MKTRPLTLLIVVGLIVLVAVAAVVALADDESDDASPFCLAVASPVDEDALGSADGARVFATFVLTDRAVDTAPDDQRAELQDLRRGLSDAVGSEEGTLTDATDWVTRFNAIQEDPGETCADE
jgi:hypothetical protein